MHGRRIEGIRRFGSWWIVVLAGLVAAALIVAVFVHAGQLQSKAAAEVARYTPAPLPSATVTTIPVVAFMGDSYTAGTGASDTDHRFATLVAVKEGWDAQDFGQGGTGYTVALTDAATAKIACGGSTCPSYPEMIPKVAAARPDIVVVSGGRNDAGVPTNAEATAIRDFYKKLRGALPDAKIIATSPIWDSSPPPASLTPMQAAVKSAVQSVKGTYLDIGEPLKGHRDWIIADGVHPNDEGHAAIAAAIEAGL